MILKGITIILHEKTEKGKDLFGHSVFEENDVEIDDVLVVPVSYASDSSIDTDKDVSKTQYYLAIPKGDSHNWKNATVEFFNKKWIVVGEPIEGIEENIPLKWNKKVTVERYE